MDLFNLYATISLDDTEFVSGIGNAQKIMSQFVKSIGSGRTVVTEFSSTFSKAKKAVEAVSSPVEDITEDFRETKKAIDDAADSAENASERMSDGFTVAKGAAADLLSSGIQRMAGAVSGLISTFVNLDESTEDFRIAMGRLNTAFESAGYGAQTAQQAYKSFYGIIGDTDTATEASQLLAQLADNAEDMSVWTNIAAGVAGTFGDSLPIESLIEAANETAKTGTVVGSLADALNWAGTVGEDEFNAMLAACSSESERNSLIMETLSATYKDAANSFYENNEALVSSRETQVEMQNTMSNLGLAIGNVKTAVSSQFAPAIAEAATMAANFINNLDPEEIAGAIQGLISTLQTLLPVITGVTAATIAYKAAVAIAGIIDGVTKATQGMTIAQAALNAVMNANPFVLIATLIAGVGTALITLWATNEDFRSAVIEIWENIKQAFVTAWENIKATWDAATGFFENIWNTIKGIFSVVESVLSGDFEGAWEAIKDVFSGWKQYFTDRWNDLTNIFNQAWDFFSGIGSDIVDGIKSGISSAWDGLTSWFNGIWNSLFGNRKATVEVEEKHTTTRANGSHAGGLGYVPFNGYLAELHKGEMVVPANQADMLRDIGFGVVGFQNSALGQSARFTSGTSTNSPIYITVQSVLDGKVIGETAYQYSRNKARAYGG